MKRVGHIIKIERIIGIIRILEVGTTSNMIGKEINMSEVTGESLRIETGHMT